MSGYRSALAAAGLSAATLSLPLPLGAETTLEGEYQIQLDVRKQDRFFPWDYDFNSDDSFGLVQFRILTQPRPEVEGFLKFEADWNRANNNGLRPELQYREAHARFEWDAGRERGVTAFVFSRQDRFWVENHLIQVVQGGQLNEDGNAQGIRVDVDGWPRGVNFNYIYSDFSGQSNPGTTPDPTRPAGTDDAHVFRARRQFLDNAVRAGFTFGRQVEGGAGEEGHTDIFHGDFRLARGATALLVEFAQSRQVPLTDRDPISLPDGSVHVPEDTDATIRAEIRAISIGTSKVGYLNIAPIYWYAGPDYVNPLGDSTRDEQGFFLDTWYLLPARAITLTTKYGQWRREVREQKKIKELYVELYTEYVNGFTSKFFYRRNRTEDTANPRFPQEFRNDDLFAEVQVESRLAKMTVQGKVKDLGTEFQKELASLVMSVNLTRTVKLYNRFTFGNDPARLRESFFAELQYRPRPGMEMFLSYGPWWIGDSPNPVDDGDLEGGAENKDILKFILKGFF